MKGKASRRSDRPIVALLCVFAFFVPVCVLIIAYQASIVNSAVLGSKYFFNASIVAITLTGVAIIWLASLLRKQSILTIDRVRRADINYALKFLDPELLNFLELFSIGIIGLLISKVGYQFLEIEIAKRIAIVTSVLTCLLILFLSTLSRFPIWFRIRTYTPGKSRISLIVCIHLTLHLILLGLCWVAFIPSLEAFYEIVHSANPSPESVNGSLLPWPVFLISASAMVVSLKHIQSTIRNYAPPSGSWRREPGEPREPGKNLAVRFMRKKVVKRALLRSISAFLACLVFACLLYFLIRSLEPLLGVELTRAFRAIGVAGASVVCLAYLFSIQGSRSYEGISKRSFRAFAEVGTSLTRVLLRKPLFAFSLLALVPLALIVFRTGIGTLPWSVAMGVSLAIVFNGMLLTAGERSFYFFLAREQPFGKSGKEFYIWFGSWFARSWAVICSGIGVILLATGMLYSNLMTFTLGVIAQLASVSLAFPRTKAPKKLSGEPEDVVVESTQRLIVEARDANIATLVDVMFIRESGNAARERLLRELKHLGWSEDKIKTVAATASDHEFISSNPFTPTFGDIWVMPKGRL